MRKALSVKSLRCISERVRLYILRSSESQYFSSSIPAAIEDHFEVAGVAIFLVVRARSAAPLGACDGHSEASERLCRGQQQFDSIKQQP